jgi:hypothetical protein
VSRDSPNTERPQYYAKEQEKLKIQSKIQAQYEPEKNQEFRAEVQVTSQEQRTTQRRANATTRRRGARRFAGLGTGIKSSFAKGAAWHNGGANNHFERTHI